MMPEMWDEPAGATTPRGWLFERGGLPETTWFAAKWAIGFYLDYGPEHYRSDHRYCGARDRHATTWCRECQPGNVLAVLPDRDAELSRSHWFLTVAEAKAWIERRSA